MRSLRIIFCASGVAHDEVHLDVPGVQPTDLPVDGDGEIGGAERRDAGGRQVHAGGEPPAKRDVQA